MENAVELLRRQRSRTLGRPGSAVRALQTYEGSQTAPPCSEGVTWFVMKTPMEISAEAIAAFAKLYSHDVRPLQPRNGRVVKESQ